jgi:NADPH-dependent 2,4-dienoyl-CoA reductase/sulfur reductase-like enzyme
VEKVDILIIGGSAASLSTCITARRYYPDAKITIIRKEKEGQVLVPCGIPYVFGTVDGLKQNIVSDAILATNNVDLIVDEATEINRRKKTVTTAQGKTMGYEKLVLATGANPTIIPLPGYDLENVYYTLKDMDYLNKLLSALDAAKNIVIIGGGFIGLEFSDEFKKRGLNVTVVEALPHCLQLVFASMSGQTRKHRRLLATRRCKASSYRQERNCPQT